MATKHQRSPSPFSEFNMALAPRLMPPLSQARPRSLYSPPFRFFSRDTKTDQPSWKLHSKKNRRP